MNDPYRLMMHPDFVLLSNLFLPHCLSDAHKMSPNAPALPCPQTPDVSEALVLAADSPCSCDYIYECDMSVTYPRCVGSPARDERYVNGR